MTQGNNFIIQLCVSL